MLSSCPLSSLHRTASKGELRTDGHEILHLSNPEDEKHVLQPPHQIVIGFHLGTDSSRNLHTRACESPRSVLEPHHLCFRSHNQSVRSPRSPFSALGSLLSSSPSNVPCTGGAALRVEVAIKAEEAAVGANAHHRFSRKGNVERDFEGGGVHTASPKRERLADRSGGNTQNDRVTCSRTNYVEVRENQRCRCGRSDHVRCVSCANSLHPKTFLKSGCHGEDHAEAVDDVEDVEFGSSPVSIFSTASPVSYYLRRDSPAVDFLSKCFLCRRHLLQGKDIYMYRGDRAFCSQECRYQQIVVDERKERRPAAVTCVSGVSTHHQGLRGETQAAVA